MTVERTIFGLLPNTDYVVKVRAYNNLGVASNWSEAYVVTTDSANAPTISTVSYTAGVAFQLSTTRNATLYLTSAAIAWTAALGPPSGTTTTVASATATTPPTNATIHVPMNWWVKISTGGVGAVAVFE